MKTLNKLVTTLLLSSIVLFANPGQGLWMVNLEVTKVTELRTGFLADTTHPFNLQFVFHQATAGRGKILKEVYLMQTKDAKPSRVLVVSLNKTSAYNGIIRRGDNKLVPVRFSSPSIAFKNSEKTFSIGASLSKSSAKLTIGDITQDKDATTNPFRHQFHPEHKSGFEITQSFNIDCTAPTGEDGTFKGTFSGKISGLTKTELEISGKAVLTRISQIKQLIE